MSRFREARDRGGRFLASLMRPDGGVPDCETGGGAYWGYPIALMVSGHSNEASRLLNWVRKNQFTPEGAIGASEAEYKLSQFSYHIGWLAEGAHRLGQFDLSQRGVDYNMRFFDEESGGFYAHPTERSAETKQEVWITAGAGRGALYAGRFDVAKAVGRWFERLMDLQPEYPQISNPLGPDSRASYAVLEASHQGYEMHHRKIDYDHDGFIKPESTEGGRRVSVLRRQEGAPVLLG